MHTVERKEEKEKEERVGGHVANLAASRDLLREKSWRRRGQRKRRRQERFQVEKRRERTPRRESRALIVGPLRHPVNLSAGICAERSAGKKVAAASYHCAPERVKSCDSVNSSHFRSAAPRSPFSRQHGGGNGVRREPLLNFELPPGRATSYHVGT